MDSKNKPTENLKQIGADFAQKQLNEILADEEKSRIFFMIIFFCLTMGKNVHEPDEIVGDKECS